MENFQYQSEQFADIRILRFRVPGFEQLSLKHKKQLFYLQEAALWGRDIIYDQNYKHNIQIRKFLEHIYRHFNGDRLSADFTNFTIYLKRIWFSNGIHHHNSMDKFYPQFDQKYFKLLVQQTSDWDNIIQQDQTLSRISQRIETRIFDQTTDAKRVSLENGIDMIHHSANNYYEGVSQSEVEAYYAALVDPSDPRPPSYGLNSKLIKQDGKLVELVWKIGGMYSPMIEQMVASLEIAKYLCDTELQQQAFEKLIDFYRSGDLRKFDEYSILWLQDYKSTVDAVHGFIEVYGDPMGKKASYESVVSIRDEEASKRAEIISNNAQWFENHSSTAKEFKKDKVEGVSAKAIFAVVEAGDCSPATPIGINLPNAEWIREQFGSKSVSISNILEAYDEASKGNGALEEFAYNEREVLLSRKWSNQASALHVDLHEIIGHGSGKLLTGVADPSDTLKNYASTLEEARADLVALYFAIDPKLVELGLQDSIEVGFAEYISYIRGGLMTQLVRVELGKNLEESHMRNRQIIASWAYEKGKAENIIERIDQDGKTYFVVNDYSKLRNLFGKLLAEVQRIKSEGDYEAGKNLVENYGVQIDYQLHQQILQRWEKLKIAPYAGFINPQLTPIFQAGEMVDVQIDYPMDFTTQMLHYSQHYSISKPLILE